MRNYLYIHNHFLDIKNRSNIYGIYGIYDIYSSLVLLCDAIGTSGCAGSIDITLLNSRSLNIIFKFVFKAQVMDY